MFITKSRFTKQGCSCVSSPAEELLDLAGEAKDILRTGSFHSLKTVRAAFRLMGRKETLGNIIAAFVFSVASDSNKFKAMFSCWSREWIERAMHPNLQSLVQLAIGLQLNGDEATIALLMKSGTPKSTCELAIHLALNHAQQELRDEQIEDCYSRRNELWK